MNLIASKKEYNVDATYKPSHQHASNAPEITGHSEYLQRIAVAVTINHPQGVFVLILYSPVLGMICNPLVL